MQKTSGKVTAFPPNGRELPMALAVFFDRFGLGIYKLEHAEPLLEKVCRATFKAIEPPQKHWPSGSTLLLFPRRIFSPVFH
jgi:hypothetical protein